MCFMEKVKRKEIKNTFLVHRVYLAKKSLEK